VILESALLIRWLVGLVVIILLLIAFYVALRIIKQKGWLNQSDAPVVKKNKMHMVDQFYIDSKNKIIKVADGENIMTILVGSNASFIKQEKIKKVEEES
tara:strand:+ start:153 stop:449 length:297 start_codon:yes stop_codon:yes gene_type:complete